MPNPRLTLVAAAIAAALAGLAAPAAAQHGRLFDPKDLGLLEPDRDAYQKPEQVMDALRIADGSIVADLGAGGGWFTVRLARRVGPNGRVYAEDVQHEMIEAIRRRVERENMSARVVTVLGTPSDPGLPTGALDAVLIVDAYQEMEDKVALLRSVARALKPHGRLGIINFNLEGGGPGPAIDERVAPERVLRDATAAGLRLAAEEHFLRYQYMLVFEKADDTAAR